MKRCCLCRSRRHREVRVGPMGPTLSSSRVSSVRGCPFPVARRCECCRGLPRAVHGPQWHAPCRTRVGIGAGSADRAKRSSAGVCEPCDATATGGGGAAPVRSAESSPLGEDGTTCLVKVYEESDDLKLNQAVCTLPCRPDTLVLRMQANVLTSRLTGVADRVCRHPGRDCCRRLRAARGFALVARRCVLLGWGRHLSLHCNSAPGSCVIP